VSSKTKTLKEKGLKLISVSDSNYFKLKKLGLAGDSFNDVITKILSREESSEKFKQTSVGGHPTNKVHRFVTIE
jgi:predicted CopG family antitoxin